LKPIRKHTKSSLKLTRKKLRSKLTPAEAFLWKYLKSKQLDHKRFTRQHSIGSYVVDFYCPSQKLIIELDGEVHFNHAAEEYDKKRTAFLNEAGFTVIRFENKMVFEHLSSVLDEIKSNFNNESG